jgi:phospholipid/cholesterol/gamma-HCH transport system ATP-binding protein
VSLEGTPVVELPSSPAAPVLDMTDVAVASLHVPGRVVLEDVNWAVRAGESWVIGGLPVSGKSDLLAAAAGLMRPPRGMVRLFGEDLAQLHEDARLRVQLRVGMVFGYGGRLFNHMTVAENLALPLCYHQNCVPSSTQERVQKILGWMELMEVAPTTPAVLNRNLRQRVALARALVMAPELLVLDNPLASLDPREARWWIKFLRELRQNHPVLSGHGVTLIVGTDDLRPWGDDAHQFAFISNGRFQPVGSRADVLQQNSPALRQLLPADWLKA